MLEFASVGAVIVADVVLLYIVADFVVDVVSLPFQYLYVAVISFLNIAYNVASDADTFKLLNAVVASLFVFHPTNVYPFFVALVVKSTAELYPTVADVFVADVPPFSE